MAAPLSARPPSAPDVTDDFTISARMTLASPGVKVATFWLPSTRFTPLRWANAKTSHDFENSLLPDLEIVC